MAEIGSNATVAFVASVYEDSVFPYCTGVWINKDTLLTALHCAKAAAQIQQIKDLPDELKPFAKLFMKEIEDPTGTVMMYSTNKEVTGLETAPTAMHRSRVLAIDSKHDLAILKAEQEGLPDHPHLRVANLMPPVGTKVHVIGHPGGLYFTVMQGTVAAVRESFPSDDFEVEGPFIQVHSAIYKGNSGGAVINEQGEIVGIVSFIARSPNQGFCLAPPAIKKFIISTYYKNLL
jgi:hypothetical protein